jgi:uncharacterized protein (DUF58 family)
VKLNLDDIKRSADLELLARQMVEGFITGLHKSPYHGFSAEFAEHRLYNEGQSTRHIDWKVYARTDRLFTKQFEEETNLRCMLVIDGSSSMHYPVAGAGKLLFSLYSAAALAYLLHRQRDAVGLTVFTDRVLHMTPVKSTASHLDKLITLLDNLLKEPPIGRPTRVADVLHEIAEKIHRRSLVVIFSDMFEEAGRIEEAMKALQHLKHNKHEVLLYHVCDYQTELEFEFSDRPHEFVDLETGEKLKLNPAEVRDQYRLRLRHFLNDIRSRCGQLKIDLIEADIRQDFHEVLQAYMIKRAKMG